MCSQTFRQRMARRPARVTLEIKKAVLAAGMCKNLRISKVQIQGSTDAGDMLRNEGLEPALRLSATERLARLCGKRMAMIFEVAGANSQRAGRDDLRSSSRASAQAKKMIVPSKVNSLEISF
jgi:hypothetical protein